jgi:hypothetical protein
MNQTSRSLTCTIINQKGGLAQNAEEIKTKAKQDMAAPGDYTEMIFQLQVFVALIKILFGEESIVASKLKKFIHLIEVNSIFYKGRAALDNFFPSMVLWSVCTRFQLFHDNCTHAEERERMYTTYSLISWWATKTSSLTGSAQPSRPASKN